MGKAQPYESEGQNIIIFLKKEQFMPDYIYLGLYLSLQDMYKRKIETNE